MKTLQIALNALLLTLLSSLTAGETRPTQQFNRPDAAPAELTASDWSSIRQEYEKHRHAVFAVESGYQARNPEQQWRADFDGRGFTALPDAGGWQWGLELRSYGFAGKEHFISSQSQVKVEGQRLIYIRDAELEEWFVNDARGLEHGFTLKQRPVGAVGSDARLQLDLAVRGGLRPNIFGEGMAVSFVDAHDAPMLVYTGLKVYDANGKLLPAKFSSSGTRLLLTVDDRGARYPLTVDPIAQQAYLKASNTEANDFFGFSVAVSNDTVVVGATGEDSIATGVNGNQSDNSASNAGAAYVFVRSGTTWTQQAYLKASNTDAGDIFGSSVAISGDTIVVGAPLEDSTGNGASNAGAAYVFVRSGTTWSQQAYLKASNTEAGDQFGISVAASGDTVVIGAPQEDSNATGVNGNGSNNSAFASGAAYVFVRSGTAWSQQAYLKASNTEANDIFGQSVTISADTVVVGAYGEASAATGVNGNQTDNSAALAGAAYVFVRSGTTWSQQAYLKASNTNAGDNFGWSAAVSGDTLVVGALGEDSNATGVNGNQSDNNAMEAGAAYVFVRSGTTWSQQAYLKASNTDANDAFGYSVAVSGDTVVVGAIGESSNATGINGNGSDNSALESGAAYVFGRSGTTWSQKAYLKASNTDAVDQFGNSVAVSGDTVVIGAPQEDSNATGVNGNQLDNSASNAGAAYVFSLTSVVSHKMHGSVSGDIALPLSSVGGPTSGSECRNPGGTGDPDTTVEYEIVFTFANPLTSVANATAVAHYTDGSNMQHTTPVQVSSNMISPSDAHQYVVNLKGVSNAFAMQQPPVLFGFYTTVTLSGVNDSVGNSMNSVPATMGLLVGDVNNTGFVSNVDVSSVKAHVSDPVTTSNFRNDVTVNGVISNSDVSATKSHVGEAIVQP